MTIGERESFKNRDESAAGASPLRMRGRAGWLGALFRCIEGTSAVEFAVALPILIGVLIPMVDLGMGLYTQMQVETAAQAGAEYALLHGWSSDLISSAVTNATSLSGVSASPAPAQSYGCPNGTTIVSASQGSTCTNGQTAGTYVTVNAQVTYTPVMSYAAIGSSFTLSSTSVVRIQ